MVLGRERARLARSGGNVTAKDTEDGRPATILAVRCDCGFEVLARAEAV